MVEGAYDENVVVNAGFLLLYIGYESTITPILHFLTFKCHIHFFSLVFTLYQLELAVGQCPIAMCFHAKRASMFAIATMGMFKRLYIHICLVWFVMMCTLIIIIYSEKV